MSRPVLASLLLRLMAPKETQSKTVLMSILRHLEGGLNVLKPKTLSIDEDKHLILLRKGKIMKCCTIVFIYNSCVTVTVVIIVVVIFIT